MNRANLLLTLVAGALLTACGTTGSRNTVDLESLPPDHPALSEQHLLEILHYAFLWHYDRSFFLTDQAGEELEIFFRSVPRELDPGDNSEFAELWIPDVQMLIELKRSDYRVEELNLDVRDDHYKVRRVVREGAPPAPLSEYQRHSISHARVRDWFGQNIRLAEPLSDTLAKRLREALIEFEFRREPDVSVAHVFHMAPISPASDELWVFHENTKQLLLFSSDMDLSNEDYWVTTPIHLAVYDLEPEVILAPDDQAAGTSRLSKDFVGRALFNCVVLGQRIEMSPEAAQAILDEKAARERESE